MATPGRILDHLRNTQSFGLEDLAVLILDEADRYAGGGGGSSWWPALSVLQPCAAVSWVLQPCYSQVHQKCVTENAGSLLAWEQATAWTHATAWAQSFLGHRNICQHCFYTDHYKWRCVTPLKCELVRLHAVSPPPPRPCALDV